MLSGGGDIDRHTLIHWIRDVTRVIVTVARRLLSIVATGVVLMPAAMGGVHGDVPEKIYTYSIQHPTHGDIGVYRNTIVDSGAEISVRNEIQVQVKVLLVVAHDEKTKSKELWKNGRLVSFTGVTNENGRRTVVTGEAEGSKFVVEAPDGPKEAPAGVFPNNPWSKAILKASVLLGTKSGALYNVKAAASEPRELVLGERKVTVDYFRVQGDARYELWFDARGVAVKFAEIGEHGVITFNLVDETVRPASASTKARNGSG